MDIPLRMLAPDIFGLVGATLILFGIVAFACWIASALDADAPASVVEDTRALERSVWKWARRVWYVIVLLFFWHALTVTWSVRIPRSDVNATGVYQQMDDAMQGKTK